MHDRISSACAFDGLNHRVAHGSNISLSECWSYSLRQGYETFSAVEPSHPDYQFNLIRFLRRHRLEGVFSLSNERYRTKIVQKIAGEVSSRYVRRECEQRALWECIQKWAHDSTVRVEPIKSIAFGFNRLIGSYPRFSEDIDILIESRNIVPTVSFLMSQGFKALGDLTISQAVLCIKSLKSLNFYSQQAVCSIDLHIDAIPRGLPGSLTLSDWIALPPNSPSCSRNSQDALVNHQLLLIVSIFKDNWSRLDKILNLAMIEEILNESERIRVRVILNGWGYSRVYNLTFFLLSRLQFRESEANVLTDEYDRNMLSAKDQRYANQIFIDWFVPSSGLRRSAITGIPALLLLDHYSARIYYLIAKIIYPTQNDMHWLPQCCQCLVSLSLVRSVRILVLQIRRISYRVLRLGIVL